MPQRIAEEELMDLFFKPGAFKRSAAFGGTAPPPLPRPPLPPGLTGPSNLPAPRYGESRFTRAPVFLGSEKELPDADLSLPGTGLTSDYSPVPGDIERLPTELQRRIPKDRGSIYVNPAASTDETNRIIRHESVHNLLSQLGVDMHAFNSRSDIKPLFQKVASAFRSVDVFGDSDYEAPAYLAANPGRLPVDSDTREAYLKALLKHVKIASPRAGEVLARMIRPGGDTQPVAPPRKKNWIDSAIERLEALEKKLQSEEARGVK